MTINWPEIAGTLIAAVGGLGSLLVAIRWFWGQRKAITAAKVTTVRSADAGPPPGAVAWVSDIRSAMGSSHAEHVVLALLDGCCRDEARARRIKQLEAYKPVTVSTQSTVHTAVFTPQDPQT